MTRGHFVVEEKEKAFHLVEKKTFAWSKPSSSESETERNPIKFRVKKRGTASNGLLFGCFLGTAEAPSHPPVSINLSTTVWTKSLASYEGE